MRSALASGETRTVYYIDFLGRLHEQLKPRTYLEIGVRHLTTEPELAEAYVAWNSPSGACEIDLLDSPVPYSPEALARLECDLGELIAAVRRAVARGKPQGW